jgi:hypothetical protein
MPRVKPTRRRLGCSLQSILKVRFRLSILALFLIASTAPSQQWHADHFTGFGVPTIDVGEVATLPIPVQGAPMPIVSTLTTTNSPWLLGNLTGRSISTLFWLECSNNPVIYFHNDCGHGPLSNLRLFFTTDIRPYTENNGRANETGYWWCSATNSWALIAPGTSTLTATVAPAGWSDALGHSAVDTNYTSAFSAAVQHVAQIGFSFGGGCYYDNGVGVENAGASAILHVLRYDLLPIVARVENLRIAL